MKNWLAVILFAAVLAPGMSGAVCMIEPLEPQLDAAQVVYVGTVVHSSLVQPFESLRHRTRPEVMHEVEPQIILKGDPSSIPAILSVTGYSDPQSRRFAKFAELVRISPGDTLLVVGDSGDPAYVGLCSASRRWDQETANEVRAIFPSAP